MGGFEYLANRMLRVHAVYSDGAEKPQRPSTLGRRMFERSELYGIGGISNDSRFCSDWTKIST